MKYFLFTLWLNPNTLTRKMSINFVQASHEVYIVSKIQANTVQES